MPNPRRKRKDEFWVVVIVAGVIVYSLLASWWKEHVIIGSIILSVLLVVAGYVLYKYASLRGWLGHQVKDTIQKTVFENVASDPNFHHTKGMRYLNGRTIDVRMSFAAFKVNIRYTILI